MWQSLRTRLALSHTLPVLVFVALLGFTLLYRLERAYFLDTLATELAGQGAIIASFTREEPQLWRNPALAQYALEQIHQRTNIQLMLIDPAGRVVAAVWFGEPNLVGDSTGSRVVLTALTGKSTWAINRTENSGEQLIDVAVPVVTGDGRILGVVRLSHNLEEIQHRLAPLRNMVVLTILVGMVIALSIGLLLAQSVAAPLRRLAAAVAGFSPTAPQVEVNETGPTEVRTLAVAFNNMTRRLHESEQARRALITGIVHELGRPLGAIKAAAQTIRNSGDPSLVEELAAGIDEQIDQMRLQIDDLALLGEMELQDVRLDFQPVDLGELMEQQCRQFQVMATEREITLTCQEAPALPLITADPKRLTQIVDNLIHNALKYTPAGGTVIVSAAQPTPQEVVLNVADDGPGIDPAEHARIFHLFYRSPSQQRLHQGMGIGLALARRMAQRHGGDLTVQSTLGHGATFSLRLPVKPPNLATP